MVYKLCIYIISLMLSIFAVSGININSIFKKGHIKEANVFMLIVIVSLTYLLANFILDITSINLMPLT
ncbi:MAG: DUF1146 domain-containing protein [Bacilli bacterium]|nr:DUF1146 domain-containing protein [Bacilli bacterium]